MTKNAGPEHDAGGAELEDGRRQARAETGRISDDMRSEAAADRAGSLDAAAAARGTLRDEDARAEDEQIGLPIEGDDDETRLLTDTGEPDVLLDVPVVKVDEIRLKVENLRARVSLLARVGNLVTLDVGAEADLGSLDLDIKGVEAQAVLKVRLQKVYAILSRTLTTIDRTPELLTNLLEPVGETIGALGKTVEKAVPALGESVGRTVEQTVPGLGETLGRTVEKTVPPLGDAVGATIEDTAEPVAQAIGATVEDAGTPAAHAVPSVVSRSAPVVGEALRASLDPPPTTRERPEGHARSNISPEVTNPVPNAMANEVANDVANEVANAVANQAKAAAASAAASSRRPRFPGRGSHVLRPVATTARRVATTARHPVRTARAVRRVLRDTRAGARAARSMHRAPWR